MTAQSVGHATPSQQLPQETDAWVDNPSSEVGDLAGWITHPGVMPDAAPSQVSPTDFYLNPAERDAAQDRAVQIVGGMARQEEAKARAEQAKLERAKLATGSTLPPLADPSTITLEFAMATDTATVKLEFLKDPFLPRGCVVCFAGRGGTAKSSFLATTAAQVSGYASTLWVSVEEPVDWIKVRHIKAGGVSGALAIFKAVVSQTDAQGRVIGSSFNVYEHLEPSIRKAKAGFAEKGVPPLRLVVLDTAVGLTAWAKGESPNDDAAVKKLLGYLQSLAEEHDLTIAFISHSNKSKHDYFADTVAGASAWTNSPRLSFVHARDRRTEHAFVMRVAKSNLTQAFATTYATVPVHTLHERAEGGNSVLCRADLGELVWGEEESMALFEDATRRPKEDDDDTGGLRLPSLADNVVKHVVEMVTTSTEPVTRDMVHQQLGRTCDARMWLRVEGQLLLNAFMYGVTIERGLNNRAMYVRTTTPVVPPAP